MRKQILVTGIGLMALAGSAIADTWTGVLIDNKCGKDLSQEEAAKHEKACVLMCADTGLGIVMGKKWYRFDEAGQTMARAYLVDEKTTTRVKVDGTMEGDVIKVTKLTNAGG